MIHRLILAISLACLLPTGAFAEAPVVDDSENFALLDEQQATNEPALAQENYDDNETALAKDNVDSNVRSNAGLLDKLQGLQQEIQELRGQLEVQARDIKLMQEQQLSFYKDLDSRISQAPTPMAKQQQAPAALTIDNNKTSPTPPPMPSAMNATHANPADEQISYLAAYELIKNKQFDQALAAMQKFVAKYPQGGYTANAEYWLGELYMVKKNYPEATTHFEKVTTLFPSSSKCSASLLKIGYAMAAEGRTQEAKERLRDVVKKYPDTNTAQLAAAKLEALGG